MSEELRNRVSKVEAGQEVLEKVLFRIDDNVKFLVDRIARLGKRVNHLSERIDRVKKSLSERICIVERRINGVEKSLSERIDRLEDRMSSQFK